MNRLVIRYLGGACMSTDMVEENWEPALAEMLPRHLSWKEKKDKKVKAVEMAIYGATFLKRWQYWPIEVDLDTWVYTPADPTTSALETAPTKTTASAKAKRPCRSHTEPTSSAPLPVRPSRREKKVA